MKKKFIFGLFLVFIALASPSCEGIGNCESCKSVTTDSSTGQVTEEPVETEYCGAQLALIKTKTYVNGNQKTVYICH
jgi:hypothetical protein